MNIGHFDFFIMNMNIMLYCCWNISNNKNEEEGKKQRHKIPLSHFSCNNVQSLVYYFMNLNIFTSNQSLKNQSLRCVIISGIILITNHKSITAFTDL